MEPRTFTLNLDGKTITVGTGKYAQQAGGSCLLTMGETVVLVNSTMSESPREGIDFFPLSVEFEEKQYAVGKIPGGFMKREGRPQEKAILTSRLIDRPLRPLFPKGFYNDVQVVATVLSVEPDFPPEVLGMIGSSISLSISPIPFQGPTGSVVVGMIEDQFVLNPNQEERSKSRLHLTVSGTKDAVMMVEAGCNEVSEAQMLDAILFAHENIKKVVAFVEEIQAAIGKEKITFTPSKASDAFEQEVEEFAKPKLEWAFDTFDRSERSEREKQTKQEVKEHFAQKYPEGEENKYIGDIIYGASKMVVREKIMKSGVRPDGRSTLEVRPIWCEVGILPRPHGSAVFTRGETQVMNILTLGVLSEAQIVDGLDADVDSKRYMHQYNFPPYSTGEAKMMRSPGRREIGHGALAERALLPMLPSEEEFPYSLRLVSEAISSNGSTSMASVCGSTLSLMDAGVPIRKPVAGAAMGLIQDPQTKEVVVLTDIQGLEDFFGDMDFKVAGTKDGITAIQMDIKVDGINKDILERALAQALDARLHILGKMLDVLPEPRAQLSKYAPKIVHFTIDPEKIRDVIGSGGKVINKIIDATGVKIDIEDSGDVYVASDDQAAIDEACKMIQTIVKDIEVGEEYDAKVVRIMNFGAFLELSPGKDGMLHISKMDNKRVEQVTDVMNIGDIVKVRVAEIDDQGRVNLMRPDLPPRPEGDQRGERPPRRDNNSRGGGSERRDGKPHFFKRDNDKKD